MVASLVLKRLIRKRTLPVPRFVARLPQQYRPWAAPLLIACATAVVATAAHGRSAPDLSELDLQLKPADVAPPPQPLQPREPTDPRTRGQSLPEVVSEVDQVRQNPTPNRRTSGTGPLDDLGGSDGLIQELLENKTIPLFRVRVAPPF